MDVKEALKMYEDAKGYWSDIYQAFREDVRFSIGLDHWSDHDIKKRGKDNCMIVPILPQFIHQVVNDMRQNTPSINVLPGEGEGSDPETAKIFKGLIRNIEYKSNADEVYDTAGEYAVRGGFGFIRVDHDYIDGSDDLQELKLRRVQNPESVYLDPRSTECDGSDAEWGIVLDNISKEDFERSYKGKEYVSFGDLTTDSKAETITIAEVFVKEYEAEDIRRKKPKIGRYKFSGSDLLEETTFPGQYVPIAMCAGEEVWVENKRYLMSLIRLAKDSQRRLNKWAAKESQLLDMAPVAPILAPLGSIEDIQDGWTSPDDTVVLRYKMKDANGEPLNKPERLQPPAIPTGIINAMEGAKESVKEALGMYNASVGQKSNAISGVAYDAQKTEADVATFHFADNRNRAIQYAGRIIVCAAPEVYDTARIIQIVGDEENVQTVGINGAPRQLGQEHEHDLTKGKYDVRVTTGASYTTKRQEAASFLGEALKANPQLMGIIGDLYFKNLDVAGSEAIAARVRKTIPKELIADEDAKLKGEQSQDPEKMQMMQALQQMQAQIQAMGAELESKQADTQLKQAELQLKAKELDVKTAEATVKMQQMQKPDSSGTDVQSEAFDQSIKQREMAIKEAELQLKINQAKYDVAKTLLEAERMKEQPANNNEQETPQENVVEAAQTEAVIQSLTTIAQQLNQLTTQVSQPKQVMRDPNTGLIVGVQ